MRKPIRPRLAGIFLVSASATALSLWTLASAQARLREPLDSPPPETLDATSAEPGLGADLAGGAGADAAQPATPIAATVASVDEPANNDPQPGTLAIGTLANPFSNTCDGKAIGFVGPTGERPRMEFHNVPQGAVLQCRSGRASDLAGLPFRACDGSDGTQPFHVPALTVEGSHRTEVRAILNGRTVAAARADYYVHRSLDRVACCAAAQSDAAWFAAALTAIPAADAFDDATRVDNPFITIGARAGSRSVKKTLLSLRRTFVLSPDRKLLLIRRTMASRRTFERNHATSCVGLAISVPTYGSQAPFCKPQKESAYKHGTISPKCPSIYCTVTSCQSTPDGCSQVTHTFNRGPGQQPWVVREPRRCGKRHVLKAAEYQCGAYVLNRNGQAACLAVDNGRIRTVTTIAGDGAPGLHVLGEQRRMAAGADHYVFSAKTASAKPLKQSGAKSVLYLRR